MSSTLKQSKKTDEAGIPLEENRADVSDLMENCSDEDLVSLAQQGRDEAFGALVKKYERMAYNLAYRMLGEREAAEDLAQDAFLRAYRGLDGFRGDANFSTWLHRIVVNTSINRQRYWSRRERDKRVSYETPRDDESRSLEQELSDDEASGDPFEETYRAEQAQIIQAAIDDLSAAHRAVIVLREIEGKAYAEIAEILEISEGTVKSRISRARKALREELRGIFHA